MLAALRAQAELSDFLESNLVEGIYTRIIDEYVPKHLQGNVAPEKIAAEHKKLKGKSVRDANVAYLKFVQGWKLYGATIFEVLVSKFNNIGFHPHCQSAIIHKHADQDPLACCQ